MNEMSASGSKRKAGELAPSTPVVNRKRVQELKGGAIGDGPVIYWYEEG
jgi:hypothetical protein